MIRSILSGFAAALLGLLASALFYAAARMDDGELTRGKVPYSGYSPELNDAYNHLNNQKND